MRPSNALELPLRKLKPLEFVPQALPAAHDIGQLPQVLLRFIQTTRPGDLQTFRQGGMELRVPVQSSEEFLIDRHRDHIRETLECD